MPATSSQRLDPNRLQTVLSALQRERQRFRRSRFEQRAFVLFQVVISTIPATLLLLWLSAKLGWADKTLAGAALFALLVGLLIVSLLALVPLISLNVPLIRTAVRQAQIERDIGYRGELADPPRRLPLRVLRAGLWTLLALLALSLVAAILSPAYALALALALLPAVLLVSNQVLHRVRDRLRLLQHVDRLHRSLRHRQQEAAAERQAFVELPREEAERLAEVEAQLIRRSRMTAIDDARRQPSAAFTTFKSSEVRQRMSELTPEACLLIESVIEELAFDPMSAGISTSDGETRKLPVPEAEAAIVYRVDQERRQVRLLDIPEDRTEEAARPSEAGNDG